jgi:hypothetical protein
MARGSEMATKGRLFDFGGNAQRHYASFTLEYDGRTKAQITIEVAGPAPLQDDLAALYKPLLHRLGVVAQEAAVSPQALSWPDHLLKE